MKLLFAAHQVTLTSALESLLWCVMPAVLYCIVQYCTVLHCTVTAAAVAAMLACYIPCVGLAAAADATTNESDICIKH